LHEQVVTQQAQTNENPGDKKVARFKFPKPFFQLTSLSVKMTKVFENTHERIKRKASVQDLDIPSLRSKLIPEKQVVLKQKKQREVSPR